MNTRMAAVEKVIWDTIKDTNDHYYNDQSEYIKLALAKIVPSKFTPTFEIQKTKRRGNYLDTYSVYLTHCRDFGPTLSISFDTGQNPITHSYGTSEVEVLSLVPGITTLKHLIVALGTVNEHHTKEVEVEAMTFESQLESNNLTLNDFLYLKEKYEKLQEDTKRFLEGK